MAGVPVLVMEIGLGQYTSQGGITAWKICPIFQGKKSSKPHSSSGGLIHVLSLSTIARHEMSEIKRQFLLELRHALWILKTFDEARHYHFRFNLLYSYAT